MLIHLDRPRTLKFNYNSWCWLEETLATQDNPGNYLRALLWACLRHEDKSLTLEQVGDMMNPGNLAEIREKCQQVASEFFPKVDARPLSEGSADSNGGPSAVTTSSSVN